MTELAVAVDSRDPATGLAAVAALRLVLLKNWRPCT